MKTKKNSTPQPLTKGSHSSPRSKIKKSSGRHKRNQNWSVDFNGYIDLCRNRQYEWGKHDCMTFAAGAIISSGIDKDILKDWRGEYETAKKAKAIIAQKKGGIRDWAAELLSEFPLIREASMKPGDVVLVNYYGKDAMGVCVGSQIAVLGKNKLEFISSSHVVTTWGIGHK